MLIRLSIRNAFCLFRETKSGEEVRQIISEANTEQDNVELPPLELDEADQCDLKQ